MCPFARSILLLLDILGLVTITGSLSCDPTRFSFVVLGDVAVIFFVRWLLLGNLCGDVCYFLRVVAGPADGLIGYSAALSVKTS